MEEQSLRLDLLPTEVLHLIIKHLWHWEVEDLSLVNKRLRGICLPFIFRQVNFNFSEAGLHGLRQLAKSSICQYVKSLTYTVPELIKPDVMDFECFKSELLTPENYMTEAKELYDVGYPADECPLYMVIYDTLKGICKDQQEIIKNNLDVEVLSSSLRALPRLNKLDITFCQSLDAEEWVDSYLALGMTAKEKSNQHHIQTVTRALNSVREGMLSLKTLCLSFLELPYYSSWKRPNLSELSNSLKCLLDYCTILRVTESSAPLELLSDMVLNISQLDLGYVCIPYTAWRGFLEANRQSIQSIGFYDTTLIGMSRADSQLYKLSPELLPTILRGFQFKVSESTDCCEIPSWETGWRVQLSLPRSPAKRKIADVS